MLLAAATLFLLSSFYFGSDALTSYPDTGCQLACKPPACAITNCPRQMQAKCRATCNGCIPHFFDQFGNEVTNKCQCKQGVKPQTCRVDPCKRETCPNHPNAVCRTNTCGSCKAVFYNSRGREVKCKRPNPDGPKCPKLAPGTFGPCVELCSSDDDCRKNQKCCWNGCGHQCTPPSYEICPAIACLVNACKFSTCAQHTQAKCKTTCSGCVAHFFDKFGNEITDQCSCPGRIFEADCKSNLCKGKTCPGYPDAECRINRCGGCNIEFFDKKGKKLTCAKQDDRCPRINPPGNTICLVECNTNDDCGRGQVCCTLGCRRSCTNPRIQFDPKCPAVRKGQVEVCVHKCSSNADCRNKQICCSNGCGSQCQYPPLDDRCPPPDPEIIKNLPFLFCPAPTCYHNGDCKRNDICCSNGCRQRCISPPFTDPRCPKSDGLVGICINLCSSNKDCKKSQICCSNGCGTQCRDVPQDKRCPPPDPKILQQLPFLTCLTGKCSSNSDCKGNKICCSDGCSNKCIDPPGYDPRCPLSVYPVSSIACSPKRCSSNGDCRSDYMCCGLWCGSHCTPKPSSCDPGEFLAKCRNLCKGLTCPKHPSAKCRVHGCGGCKAEFYDRHNRMVKDCFYVAFPRN